MAKAILNAPPASLWIRKGTASMWRIRWEIGFTRWIWRGTYCRNRRPGTGQGEFNYPTELRLEGNKLFVVDAMNFRVQVLDLAGKFLYAIGGVKDGQVQLFRPKGIGVDSEGHLYVVDGLGDVVQVFDRQGAFFITSASRGRASEIFNCPPDCLSMGKIVCTWLIRTIGAWMSSNTSGSRKNEGRQQKRGGRSAPEFRIHILLAFEA